MKKLPQKTSQVANYSNQLTQCNYFQMDQISVYMMQHTTEGKYNYDNTKIRNKSWPGKVLKKQVLWKVKHAAETQ